MCQSIGLEFLKSVGQFYSWSQRGDNDHRIQSRIDHYLCNPMWLQNYGGSYVHYQSPGVSDHTLLIVFCEQLEGGGGRPFMFVNKLAEHGDFLKIVSEEWGQWFFGIVERLKSTKRKLKTLFHQEFGGVTRQMEFWHSQL